MDSPDSDLEGLFSGDPNCPYFQNLLNIEYKGKPEYFATIPRSPDNDLEAERRDIAEGARSPTPSAESLSDSPETREDKENLDADMIADASTDAAADMALRQQQQQQQEEQQQQQPQQVAHGEWGDGGIAPTPPPAHTAPGVMPGTPVHGLFNMVQPPVSTLPNAAPVAEETGQNLGITAEHWARTKEQLLAQIKEKLEETTAGPVLEAAMLEVRYDAESASTKEFCEKYAPLVGSTVGLQTFSHTAMSTHLGYISGHSMSSGTQGTWDQITGMLRKEKFGHGLQHSTKGSLASTPLERDSKRANANDGMEGEEAIRRAVPGSASSTSHAATGVSSTLMPSTANPAARDLEVFQQTIANANGVNINDPDSVKGWLQMPIQTIGDFLPILQQYHVHVGIPEMRYQMQNVTDMVQALSEFSLIQAEDMAWLKNQERQYQRQRAQVTAIATGFDTRMSPSERHTQLEWMLWQVPAIRSHCQGQVDFDYHITQKSKEPVGSGMILRATLAVPPITVKAGKNWSPLTLLIFTLFDLRQAVTVTYQSDKSNAPLWWGDQAVPGKHIKVSPAVPTWQRKLESPIRVLLSVLNNCVEYKGTYITCLWPSLTVMAPQAVRDFDPAHTAIARLIITENNCTPSATLYILHDLVPILTFQPDDSSGDDDTAWSREWYKQMFGREWQQDEAETQAASAMSSNFGAAQRARQHNLHWTQALVHTAKPFPIPFRIEPVGFIPFNWSHYCRKMGRPDQEGTPPPSSGSNTGQGGAPAPTTPTLGDFLPASKGGGGDKGSPPPKGGKGGQGEQGQKGAKGAELPKGAPKGGKGGGKGQGLGKSDTAAADTAATGKGDASLTHHSSLVGQGKGSGGAGAGTPLTPLQAAIARVKAGVDYLSFATNPATATVPDGPPKGLAPPLHGPWKTQDPANFVAAVQAGLTHALTVDEVGLWEKSLATGLIPASSDIDAARGSPNPATPPAHTAPVGPYSGQYGYAAMPPLVPSGTIGGPPGYLVPNPARQQGGWTPPSANNSWEQYQKQQQDSSQYGRWGGQSNAWNQWDTEGQGY